MLAKALAITGQLPLDDGMSVGAADKDWLVDSVGREVIGAQLARIIDGWSREQMAKHELSGVGQISPLAWRIKIPS
ncbi:hypothetical protein [Hyphomicrobium sp. 1Nfss2.1]|uniref:hypothetical protein n=1 Tax=Hyphomicrobium sp. 1Nfss2.1 TaxID=3413936 RepID=UPI003C7B3CBC